MKAELECVAVRWVDDEPQPGIAEVQFADASDRQRSIIDKSAVLDYGDTITPHAAYPFHWRISCTILEVRDATCLVRLSHGMQTTDGETEFEIPKNRVFVAGAPIPASQPDPEFATARRYVIATRRGTAGRYLDLLHGNFARLPEHDRAAFVHALYQDARQISDTELTQLLGPQPEWRTCLTAARLVALDGRMQFRERIGELMLASEVCFAGQGYCVALAMLGTTADADLLAAYLDRYLRRPDCRYDQAWALGSLLHLDSTLATDRAADFLDEGGLWNSWAGPNNHELGLLEARIASLLSIIEQEPPSIEK